MQRSSLLLRVVVLGSSLLLAVGYLSYRAGAFSWLRGEAEVADDANGDPTGMFQGGSKSAPVFMPAEEPPGEKTIIYGTKFGPIVPSSNETSPPPPPPPSPSAETGKVMIMSGTKSDAGLRP